MNTRQEESMCTMIQNRRAFLNSAALVDNPAALYGFSDVI
jgi:hypothetical protein